MPREAHLIFFEGLCHIKGPTSKMVGMSHNETAKQPPVLIAEFPKISPEPEDLLSVPVFVKTSSRGCLGGSE